MSNSNFAMSRSESELSEEVSCEKENDKAEFY